MPPRRTSSLTLTIDRIDGDTAHVEREDGTAVEMPSALLPTGAARDLVLRVERTAERVTITLDRQATEAARGESAAATRRLRGRDPGGDVVL